MFRTSAATQTALSQLPGLVAVASRVARRRPSATSPRCRPSTPRSTRRRRLTRPTPPTPRTSSTPAGPSRIINASWYRINGDSIQILYNIRCVDPPEQYSRWIAVTPDSAGNLVPQVTAADLVPALSARVIRQLPTPLTRVGPADDRPDGFAFVQIRTFFWVDQVPGQWETVSGTASAGGISVTVQAEPVRLVVDPGDGSAAVSCDGAPTAVTSANYSDDVQGCHHVYLNSSSMSSNGETFPVTTTIVWHATWSASTGEGGDLGYVSTASAVRDLPVAEVQALITDG